MRKRFEQQTQLDAIPIPELKINLKTRHQLAPLVAALQYIFVSPELNEAVFEVLEKQIPGGKKQRGRQGMTLWEILVLGVIRLNLDIDYDMLQDQANHHSLVRGILGVGSTNIFKEGKYYALQTIKDNVSLLDEQMLMQISTEVVKAGHELKKKEGGENELRLRLKTDTYAVESNIHFPTDMNLLWDSIRKCIGLIILINSYQDVKGWRKAQYILRSLKRLYSYTANIHQRKGKNYQARLEQAATQYINKSKELSTKLDACMIDLSIEAMQDPILKALLEELTYYYAMLDKHIDLMERRIIKGEKIPHEEKVFSIFEPHVEWITKGKHHKKVELGHNVLITTDQFHFILDHKVLEVEADSAQPIALAKRLKQKWAEHNILESLSFDRGFYSKLAKDEVGKIFSNVVMPKKGKRTPQEKLVESEEQFVALRRSHSAVESNINELEHSGLNKVPDKKIKGFKRYVALGVLAFNLKRLGKIVIQQELLPTTFGLGNKHKKAAA